MPKGVKIEPVNEQYTVNHQNNRYCYDWCR